VPFCSLDATGATGHDRDVHKCSFCGKSDYEVGLYGGPQVAICTDCVRMMYEDIGPVEPTRRPGSEGKAIVSFSSTHEVTATPQPEVEE
jgi:hypothetical protein